MHIQYIFYNYKIIPQTTARIQKDMEFFFTSITLLNTHCLFNGPLEYKQYDAQKVEPHAQLSEHPIVLFQGSDEQLIGVK